jgi:hypothetical protein
MITGMRSICASKVLDSELQLHVLAVLAGQGGEAVQAALAATTLLLQEVVPVWAASTDFAVFADFDAVFGTAMRL